MKIFPEFISRRLRKISFSRAAAELRETARPKTVSVGRATTSPARRDFEIFWILSGVI